MTRSTQISTYYLLLLFLFPIITFGQSPINQWNVWDFGGFNSNPITIDFNSGAPVVTNVGSCYGLEGNSGISDYNGNVLFYTNGETVWDASHNIMQNGTNLYGGNSSSQAAIIVPNPANNNIYYIFTTGDGDVNQPYPAYNRELRYSEVDMTLNGGLGAVTANKAIVLQADVGEKVSATRHANNSDVWVMTHSGVSNNFHAFLVTAAGVTMAPVNTAIGYSNNQSSAGFSDKGAIRFSYNGCKVLHISRSSNWIQLFDFDNQTGNVSNLIMTDNSISSPHSAEFSPDHTKLYVSYKGFFAVPSKESYQYDLTAANIPASKVQITNGIDLIGLQLGPDGKIYGSPRWSNTIHQIQSPNALGTACNFTANAISTVPSGGNHTTGTEFPQRVPGLESDFEWTGNCGEEYTFTVIDTFPVLMDAVSWDFGDPASGSANTSTDRIATHTFSGPGTHTVKLITYLCNWTDTTEYTFEGNIDVDLGMDTTLCLGQTITLDAQNPGYNYLWQDGSTASTFLVNSPGTYFVEVSDLNSTCTGYDTIVVDYITNPDLAGNDSIIQLCESDGIIDLETYLNGNNTTTGQWIDVNNLVLLTGSTINTTTTGSGTFNVSFAVGTSAQYPDTASFTIIIGLDNINIDLGIDTTLCLGETVTLDALNPGADFVWQDASTNSTFTVNTGGTYFVEVSNNSTICLGYDTIVVDYITAPDLAGSDSTIQLCELEGIVDLETYLNGNNTTTGQWTDVNNLGLLTGSTINTTTSGSGTFNISFITGLTTPCSDTANFTIVVGADDINVDLGIDTTLCLGETVTLDALNPGADFVWQDASTNSTFTAVTGGTYFVEVSNNSTTCLGHDTIVVDYITAPDLAGSDSTIQLCELEGVIDLETYLNGNNTTTGQWTDVNNLGLLTGSTINTTTSGSGTFNISFITGLTTPCSDTANFTIVVGADDINVDLGIDTTLCLGETVTLDALNPGADFVWQDASTNSTFTVNTGGTYFVEVSNNSTTCLGHDTIVVDYITAPDLAGSDSIINLCELEGVIDLETYLNGNNTTTGQWTDVNNLGLLTGSTINTTTSGSGTFNISFITGLTTPCSDTANFTIVVGADDINVDLGIDTTLCLGETVTLDALNPGADFVWQDASTNSTFTVNTGGTYFVEVSNNSTTCLGYDTIVVDYITAPDLAGNDSIINLCELEGIVDLETYLNGNNTTTGQWTDVNNLGLLTGSTINTTTSGSGTFNISFITGLTTPCSDTANFTIVVGADDINVDLGIDTTLCLGETVTLDALNPGADFVWQDASTNSTFTVNTGGTYFVEVSNNSTTCLGYDTIVVDYITAPDLAGNDSIINLCELEGIVDLETYLNGNNTTTGQWTDVNNLGLLTGSTINTTISGSGTFNISFITGLTTPCSDTANFTIVVAPDNVAVDLGVDQTLCLGETLVLDALNPGADFVWQDGSTNSTFTVNTGGTYFVGLSYNGIGCSGQDTIVIDYITAPDLAGSDSIIELCELEGIVDLETYLNGNNTTTGQWTDVNNLGLLTGSTINTTTSGSGTFNISFITGLTTPCSDTANFTIVVGADNVNVDLGTDVTLCLGETLVLDPLNPGADFVWQDGSTNSTFTVNTGGTYFVEVDNNTDICHGYDTIVVNYLTNPDLAGSDSTIEMCELSGMVNLEDYLSGNNTTTGQWLDVNNSGFLVGSNMNTMISGSGTFNMSFITGLASGCSDTANFIINMGNMPNAGLDGTVVICNDQGTLDLLTVLNGSPDSGGSWSPPLANGGNIFDPLINPEGIYTYEVNGDSWCPVDSSRATINVTNISSLEIISVPNACLDQLPFDLTATLTGGQWSGSGITNSQIGTFDANIAGVGIHTIDYSFNNGVCSKVVSTDILIGELPTVDLGDDLTICDNAQYQLTPTTTNADSVVWSTGFVGETLYIDAMFDKAGEVLLYDVLVENSCGVATDQINVTIKDCDIYVYVPNAFTPDGDNFNETFTPVLNGIDIYDYDLFIFNRWGEILFESHNPSIGWDGTYKGELLQDGVYIWKMKYADPYTDNRIEKNGTVTLLR